MTDHLAIMIDDNAKRFASLPAMRVKVGGSWHTISYAELGRRIDSIARSLVDSGVKSGDMVAIFSPNCPEWTIADFAIMRVGAVSVPIYATSTAKQAEYVLTDADVSLVFVGEQAQYDKILSCPPDPAKTLRVVAFDDDTVLTGGDSVHLRDFEAAGAASSHEAEVQKRLAAARPEDVATLVYTSGTTGQPKGAVITHANVFHQIHALDDRFNVGPGDSSLCFLPLSHAYERGWSFYIFATGAQNCYLQDPRRIAETMIEVRPSTMVSVPRLFEKIHATVVDRIDRGPAVKARLFAWAIDVGGKYQHRRYSGRSIGPVLKAQQAVADRLVLSKIRDAVGGEKNVFSAGGAPLATEIEEFFFAAGLFICQGYGLTETTAMVSCNYPGAFRFGSVGTPVKGTEVRVAPSGEIQVRGGNIMSGYHNKPEQTAATFEDGWFKTGDIGTIDNDGFLHITDRIKDLIITSQGKNVAPQHIEAMLGADPFVEQLVVIGDRRKFLSALIEPAFPMLERYADEHGIPYSSRADLIAHPAVRTLYDRRIAERSRELANYEQVKRYTLMPTEFTMESGQVTSTMKLRRSTIENEFADLINAMYEEQPRSNQPS